MDMGYGINHALAGVRTTLFAACVLITPLVGATPVVLDFNSAATSDTQTIDYFEDGFRIRPLTCHYDIVDGGAAGFGDGTNWMGFDRSGCGGAASANLRIDNLGATFDLLSLEVVLEGWTSIVGSNGSNIQGCANPAGVACNGLLNFGAGWSGLTYVDFFSFDNPGAPVGFDNVRFDVAAVSTPGTLALLLAASAALGSRSLSARRRRRGKSGAPAA